MKINQISWYFSRLKAMSAVELIYRVQRKIQSNVNKRKYTGKVSVLDVKHIEMDNLEKLDGRIVSVFKTEPISSSSVFNHEVSIFNKPHRVLEQLNWYEGMKSDWPKDRSSYSFSYKDKDEYGDVRYTWEINRHQFFVSLALEYYCTKNQIILDQLKSHFYDWASENPFLEGVNWSSPMEIAIRAYQWLITYTIIKDIDDSSFKKDLLTAIINSAEYVTHNFSLYSSANNHLIIEAAITSIVGYCIEPIYNQNWFNRGCSILSQQVPAQVHYDGVNAEQATHYHAFVLDMLLQYNFFLRKVNKSTLHDTILFKMTEFLGYLKQGGQVTEFGDSDDAFLVNLDGIKKDYYVYVLQLASLYFRMQFIPLDTVYPEVKFLSDNLAVPVEIYSYQNYKVFKEGGYIIINLKDTFFAFDVGPLGFGSIAAHGHADALSVICNYKGNPILIDPGTYIYNIDSKWRNYFRKTFLHNTLSAGLEDQSIMAGPFLWSKKANTKLIDYGETSDIFYAFASHDGYEPRTHSREYTYLKEEETLIIVDRFKGEGNINYTFDNRLNYSKVDDNRIIVNAEDKLYFYFSKSYQMAERWQSKGFLTKEKTWGLTIDSNFDQCPQVFTIISKTPISFNNGEIDLNGKTFIYDGYKSIRGILK